LSLGPLQPSPDAILDHGPLELSEDPHHLKQGLAGWSGGVDALLMEEQVDAEGMYLGQEELCGELGDGVRKAA
jgi:hypothetical protein